MNGNEKAPPQTTGRPLPFSELPIHKTVTGQGYHEAAMTKLRRRLKVALVRATGRGLPWWVACFLFRLFRLRAL